MEADDAGTLTRLKALRADVLDPAIADHQGSLVKTTGDGILVEFPSAIDAFGCATEIQSELAERRSVDHTGTSFELRIGLHLGDILPDDGDIFGNGVNIAARLEGIAPPGGIALSGSIHEQIVGKIEAELIEAGTQTVKNISRPVEVWVWHPTADLTAERQPAGSAADGPAASKKSLLAVLPFVATGDETADLADSLADELTNAFSVRRGIEVAGRGIIAQIDISTAGLDTVQAATKADYVIAGTIRRSGNRLRVTAELIEMGSRAQLWSSRYDRDWGDMFALVDDLTERIAIAARTPMNAFEGRRFADSAAKIQSNDERRAKAAQHFYKFTKDDFDAARGLLEAIVEDDGNDAMALGMLAFCIMYRANFDAHRVDHATRRQALDLAEKAVQLDRNSDYIRYVHGLLALNLQGDYQTALVDAEQALQLNPQYGLALQLKADALIFGGSPQEGIAILQKLIDVDPRDPVNYLRYWTLAIGFLVDGQHTEALDAIEHAARGSMAIPTLDLAKAVILAHQYRLAEARKVIDAFLTRWPDMTLESCKLPPFRDEASRERYRAALADAGLPTSAPLSSSVAREPGA